LEDEVCGFDELSHDGDGDGDAEQANLARITARDACKRAMDRSHEGVKT
jgi:hypothetical protein